MTKLHFGTSADDGGKAHKFEIDLDSLLENRLLVQGASNSGKSNTIRLLIERAVKHIPCIVLDPEGEMHTLRDKLDILLVGQDGDIPAHPERAGELAHRLLELRASAVIDLFEMPPASRRLYVRNFLQAMTDAPKKLWLPTILAIDEAHMFCPEDKTQDSGCTLAVCEFMSRCRKRQFCGVLATQRISKLHKDAVAECRNMLIGACSLDNDQKRAIDILALPRESRAVIRDLPRGAFMGVGPSLGFAGVRTCSIDAAETKAPKAGRGAATVAPPSSKVKHMLSDLADLTDEQKKAITTLDEAKQRIRELEALRSVSVHSGPTEADLEHARDEGRRAASKGISELTGPMAEAASDLERDLRVVGETTASLLRQVRSLDTLVQGFKCPPRTFFLNEQHQLPTVNKHTNRPIESEVQAIGDMAKGEVVVLTAIAQHRDGATRELLTILTGYKRSSRDKFLQTLRSRGFIEEAGHNFTATAKGREALGPSFRPLPTGKALREHWLSRLGGGEQIIFTLLCERYPAEITRDEIAQRTNYKRSSRDKFIQLLAARRLVVTGARGVSASPSLF